MPGALASRTKTGAKERQRMPMAKTMYAAALLFFCENRLMRKMICSIRFGVLGFICFILYKKNERLPVTVAEKR